MNFSKITDDLFIGSMPTVNHYDQLRELGVRLIINMRFSLGPHLDPHAEPIRTLWLRSFDSPFFPISIPKLMRVRKPRLKPFNMAATSKLIAPTDVTAAWRWECIMFQMWWQVRWLALCLR